MDAESVRHVNLPGPTADYIIVGKSNLQISQQLKCHQAGLLFLPFFDVSLHWAKLKSLIIITSILMDCLRKNKTFVTGQTEGPTGVKPPERLSCLHGLKISLLLSRFEFMYTMAINWVGGIRWNHQQNYPANY